MGGSLGAGKGWVTQNFFLPILLNIRGVWICVLEVVM